MGHRRASALALHAGHGREHGEHDAGGVVRAFELAGEELKADAAGLELFREHGEFDAMAEPLVLADDELAKGNLTSVTGVMLTESGWEKVVTTAPGHVEEVRRLVFDPLTQPQQRTLRAIGHRVNQAVGPSGTCPD
ncbi:hypothetical protein [Streptomyces sp. NPDC101206]|uniref:hypothetical protein n=1 Tax=Streptomyces sp. NPDC101206 TaxID=3366128 RepID=UPI00382E251E